ncbi:MAG: amidase domain-containing protein [Clostridia bacterium]|nr:amidase domain-containing protein [Clostridia bacterium]
MKLLEYNRQAAYDYAKKWALGRNPAFYDFSAIGGDCTNFASQCIYAGAGVMNYTPTFGWFYRSANDRTPSWTGVEFLYNFLVNNDGAGPFAKEVPLNELEVGDIVQLGRATGDFYHSPVVVGVRRGNIYVAAHSYDAFNRPLSSYRYEQARGIHILGVRKD